MSRSCRLSGPEEEPGEELSANCLDSFPLPRRFIRTQTMKAGLKNHAYEWASDQLANQRPTSPSLSSPQNVIFPPPSCRGVLMMMMFRRITRKTFGARERTKDNKGRSSSELGVTFPIIKQSNNISPDPSLGIVGREIL